MPRDVPWPGLPSDRISTDAGAEADGIATPIRGEIQPNADRADSSGPRLE
jgi:hypothetical protein